MKARKTLVLLVACSCAVVSAAEPAQRLLDRIGTDRGIAVILGDSEARLACRIAQATEMLVYVQLESAADVQAARIAADNAGLYGTRVFIDKGPLSGIHLADNIADVVLVARNAQGVSEAQARRVLRPGGRLLQGGQSWTKPALEGADDWSHPYHGPDNNPQSADTVARAPYLTQFLAEPRYAPLPQVALASAGRVFKAFGHVAFKKREEPFLNKLVAFNGYNGTLLWQRDLAEGVMIHRNTMIATPDRLYVGDDKSCKVIDAATGKTLDEIIPPVDVAGGTFWKWMAMEDGVLYAMIGEQEQRDETKRWSLEHHGWPWDPVSEGFNQPDQPWGYGHDLLAIDPKTKKVLWRYHEETPIDGRALCMKAGRIYAFGFGKFLTCLDAGTGRVVWRKTPQDAPRLFRTLGEYSMRQDWRTNWRTTCYLKCSDKALYFAGPQVDRLVAVSTQDGSVLWTNDYNNFQLVLRSDGLYALSGQIDQHPSKVFDPLTGAELAAIAKERRACTRPTGAIDAVFFRASGGSVRLDAASKRPQWISPMRPNCHDGVTVANGLLYWWPSVCDCQLTLYGITCLGPAGDFDFYAPADEKARLEVCVDGPEAVAELPATGADWACFRADAAGSSASSAQVAAQAAVLWQVEPPRPRPTATALPAAPIVVGEMAFIGGVDGVVRAFNARTGEEVWKTYTGGAIRIAPTFAHNRLYVGSGDGWVYCLEARTGRILWRFLAAPDQRFVPIYGQLMSTWPVAAGVLVADGTAYVAAGLANFDGTYVYALDALTGRIKWQNTTSGHLDRDARTGVSVQGHLLLHGDKLYLAGGTSVSPAVYDAATGRCLNDPAPLAACNSNQPRGWELSLLGEHVVAVGRPFYAHPDMGVFDATVFNRVFLTQKHDAGLAWVTNQNTGRVMCLPKLDMDPINNALNDPGNRFNVEWRRIAGNLRPSWSFDCPDATAVAFTDNAAIVGRAAEIVAVRLQDGGVLWKQPIGKPVAPWGLAIDRNGSTIAVLEDGGVLCIGPATAGGIQQHARSN